MRAVSLSTTISISQDAVLSAGPVRLNGLPGWLSWLFIHIAFLTGYRNRAGAILTWRPAFSRDVRRERSFTSRQVGRLDAIYPQVGAADSATADSATPSAAQRRSR